MNSYLTGGEVVCFVEELRGLSVGNKIYSRDVIGKDRWNRIEIPHGAAMNEQSFGKIELVARSFGDQAFIISNIYDLPDAIVMVETNIGFQELTTTVSEECRFQLNDVAVFGRSLKWVLVIRGLVDGCLAFESPD